MIHCSCSLQPQIHTPHPQDYTPPHAYPPYPPFLTPPSPPPNTHRHCVRLIPVETICDANIPAIEAAAAPLVAPYFPQEGPPVPFGCVVEFRSTKHLDKMAVVNASIKGIAQVGMCGCGCNCGHECV